MCSLDTFVGYSDSICRAEVLPWAVLQERMCLEGHISVFQSTDTVLGFQGRVINELAVCLRSPPQEYPRTLWVN